MAEPATDAPPPVGTAEPVLACHGLRKRYGDRLAVDDVGFTIARGETYGLLGPNGAGKTTTISMVCGLLTRDGGEVTVAGRPMGPNATDAKAAIGLVPQDVALYDDMSAAENLTFFGRLQGLGRKEVATRVAEALELVGLTDRARDHVGKYSGGMKRRANIAAGLLHRPRLFLFLSMGMVARDLLADKRIGLLDRIRAGPVHDGAILGGKAVSVVVVGTTSLLAIWAVTALALGADWGDPVGVVALIVAAAVAVAGIAGLIAGLARTDEAADSLTTVVAFVFALVGGSFVPIGQMPESLQRLALLTPTGWALRGFAELSAGAGGVTDFVPHLAVLLAWGLLSGMAAAVLLPRRLGAT